jgi:LPXTG-site transpeptidase (sortase) family protein
MQKLFKSLLMFGILVVSLVQGPVASVYAFSFSAQINESFTPISMVAGETSRLEINIYNPNLFNLDNASFTDSLVGVQPGLRIASPVNLSNDCGGVVIATAGTTTIALSGGTVPAQVGATRGSCTISLDVTATTTGNLKNTIPAYGVPPAYGGVGLHATGRGGLDIITNNTPATATLQVSAVLAPSMNKKFTPNTVWAGEAATLEINVFNNDLTTALTQATYTDYLPNHFVVAALPPLPTGCGAGVVNAPVGSTAITLSNATILPNSNCKITVQVVSSTQGQYTNTIPAGPAGTGSLQTRQGVTNTSPASANINVQSVALTKTFSPITIQQGDTTLLTIILRNPSGADYTPIGLTDTLPVGLTFSGTPSSPQCGGTVAAAGNVLTLANATIPSGNITSPGICTIVARVTSTTTGAYTNTIPAGAMTGPVTNAFPATANLTVQSRVIGVKKTFGGGIIQGGSTSLTIELDNSASTTLTGVTFTDTMPAGLSIVGTPTASVSCGGGAIVTHTSNSVTLSNGIIPSGTVAVPGACIISATVTSLVSGSFTNTIPAGDVHSDQGVGNSASNSAGMSSYAIGGPATVSKAFLPTTVEAGSPTRLTITIQAPNDTALSGINITDTLPDDLVIVGPPAPTTTCGGALSAALTTKLIRLTGGSIATAGSSCTITVYVTSNTAGAHTNAIPGNTLATFEGRTDANNRSASLTVTSLTMSKTFTPVTVSPNGLSRLTISLVNAGLAPLDNVAVTDTLPSGTGNSIVVASPSNATTTCISGTQAVTASNQTITLSNGTIPASDGVVPGLCTISVDVQGLGVSGTLTNTIQPAQVHGTLRGTGTTIQPVAKATASLNITPLDIKVVKGFQPVLVTDGSSSVMSIELRNTFPASLSGIKFTDIMPAGMILANPVNFNVGTCGGALTGTPGSNTFSYSGGSLPGSTVCTLTLNISMTVIDNLTNEINAGDVTTFEGARNLDAASATLTNLSGASVTKSFAPNPISIGGNSILTITIKNSDQNVTLTGMGLNDLLPGALPAGLSIAASPAPDPVSTCGGTLTAAAGSQTIQLANGTLAPGGSCTIIVPVTSSIPGNYLNTIPKDALTNDQGSKNSDPTSDTLLVTGYSLGNRVWNDNGAGGGTADNGLRDGTEPGLSGVTVNLYRDSLGDGTADGVAIATTTTDSGGYYRFDNLLADTYLVEVIPPAGFITSPINGGSPTNAVDNDNNGVVVAGASIFSAPVPLGPGASEPTGETDPLENPQTGESPDSYSDRTIDFGLFRPYALGNRVWDDNGSGTGTANNGILDGTEPGLSGVTVRLYRDSNADGTPNGAAIAFTSTDSSGYYRFDGLTADSYIIEVVPPAGYITSAVNGGDPNNDIDLDNNGTVAVGSNIRSMPVTLGPGSSEPTNDNDPFDNPQIGEPPNAYSNRTVDFGFSSAYSLGNRVWDDNGAGGGTANDGIRNGSEPGIAGVTLFLFRDSTGDGTPDGPSIASTITDGNGYYRFDGLQADTYLVAATILTGYTSSSVNSTNPNNNIDNDNNGVTVNGNLISSSPVTLGPGSSEPTNDNDPVTNPQTGESPNNFSNRTLDFGFYHAPYSLGNRVWNDNGAGGGTANDGIRNGTEPGMGGVTVRLFRNSGGFAVASVLTDANGYYRFDNLVPDTYIVEVVIPAGYVVSATNGGDPDTNPLDNDNNGVVVSGGTVRSNPVTLDPGGIEPVDDNDPTDNPSTGEAANNYSNRTVDFGFAPLASIGNFVWNDLNRDGIQDAGENGLTGVRVDLYRPGFGPDGVPGNGDDSNSIANKTTAGGGLYSFDNLVPGNYVVGFTTPAGYVFSPLNAGGVSVDSDADLTTGQTVLTTLDPGENDTTWDAGMYQPPASLGDYVWTDLNRDGHQDSGEAGLNGVRVSLYRPGVGPDGIAHTADDDQSVATTLTAGNGAYLFSNLQPGNYYVIFTLPANDAFSAIDQGDDALDSDADPFTGQTATTALAPGENDLSWDAGIYQLASIGDLVWNDFNRDGIQNNAETGINGVTVRLYSGAGSLVASTTTTTVSGVAGTYRFNNLVPGDYYVVFSPPGGFAFSPIDAASDDLLDSDANIATGQAITTTLDSGENDTSWDAGLYQLASLGDRVWNDTLQNGIQDAGETGIDGATVRLFTSTGTPMGTTTTSGGGWYSFSNLVPGDYYVTFTPPYGFAFSPANQGSDDAVDSDADQTTGQTATVTLGTGANDLSLDAGVYQLLSSIGNFVWEDSNGNGIQDGTESGIGAVTVRLYDGTGTLVASTQTAPNGTYSFTNLIPGYYSLVFAPTSGFFTLINQGTDGNLDSDAIVPTGQTILTLLDPGENDMSWDAGLYQPASLGNFVWNDLNANGLQDSGEAGIPGVLVDLYRSGSGQVASTTTDVNGLYSFTNLVPGNYTIHFTLPANNHFSVANTGADDTLDSDANPATGWTDTVSLTSGQNDDTWDAGMYRYASIGDRVWDDLNANGVLDAGEPGINAATVELFRPGFGPDGIAGNADDATPWTTTTTTGAYSFTNLIPGDYYVHFVNPVNYLFSPTGQGTASTDSDANTTSGVTATTSLISGENDITWDAGMYQLASIGDRVWVDSNGNGNQDAEAGLNGVVVDLFRPGYGADGIAGNADDNLTAGTTATANVSGVDGVYAFTGLTPGNYYVRFTLPGSYQYTLRDAVADTIDSDPDPSSGQTLLTNLISGENDLTWDAGLYLPASIGDYVWLDTNGNGIQDGTESGLINVTVTLYNASNSVVGTPAVTDSNGFYRFTNLIPGTYHVGFTRPSGHQITARDRGTDDILDSDADPSTGMTAPTALVSGQNDLSWDTGMYLPASLGDFVWNDLNANGVQDAGETGINGISVQLFRPGYGPDGIAGNADDANRVASTTTSAAGIYSFSGLIPGTYYVQFVLSGSYHFSPMDVGSDATDSDANTTTGVAAQATLVSGQDDPSWDAGLYQTTSLGDRVWVDTNGDGVQDAGETGLNGVTVELFWPGFGPDGIPGNADDADPAQSTLTANVSGVDGTYTFSNLVPGSYTVHFVLPAGYEFSPLGLGDAATDSNADRATGQTSSITLVSNQTDLTWDAGVYQPASLGDRVWVDTNGNGVQDAGEPGFNGVTVTLYRPGFGPDSIAGNADDNNPVLSTQTANVSGTDGIYNFTGLIPGTYLVQFTQPAGYQFSPLGLGDTATDTNADRITGQTAPITLVSNQNDLTWDAGIYQPASLGDSVWLDTNANGVQDTGENGVNGVTVNLYRPGFGPDGIAGNSDDAQIVATTSTVSTGSYLFTNLIPGSYILEFAPSTGYSFSPADQGTDDALDSDANPATGRTIATTLISGEIDLTWDTGLNNALAALGNFVWLDTNANGVQDPNELGIDAVTVNLFAAGGTTPVATTTTAGGGYYSFTNLTPGDYFVEFVPPTGYSFSPADQGGNDALDSDANPANGRTILTTLSAGENDMSWDAGLNNNLASLGNFVWNDINANGIQDADEAGIDGVKVDLYTAAGGAPAASATTASGGYYAFTSLTPGDYYEIFTLPAGYQFSLRDAGTNDAADSDAEPATGQTSTTTLNAGENDWTWDAGINLIAKVGLAKQVVSKPVLVSPGTWDVTYEFLVRNYGTVPLNRVQVVDSLAATFPLPARFTVQSLTSSDFTVNWPGFDGSIHTNLLTGNDSLAVGGSGKITLVVRVVPTSEKYNNTATVTGEDTYSNIAVDISDDGSNPDGDENGDPSNDRDPTPVDFGPSMFDPPLGFKIYDDSGLPTLRWTMIWINNSNIVAVNALVHDPIPTGLTFTAVGTSSGYAVPLSAPPGSSNLGVSCQHDPTSTATTTSLCYYEGPTIAYPLGRIIWQGVLGPDLGAKTDLTARNQIHISFNTSVSADTTQVVNVATIDIDRNADGDTNDTDETQVSKASMSWKKETKADILPATGFAPGQITTLPLKPGTVYDTSSNMTIEIPALGIITQLVGIPVSQNTWDITWLGNQLGYLAGTAFPTWAGNSVITGHVYGADGLPGPFVDLARLKYGDQIIVHAFGQRYIYEVRTTFITGPNDTSIMEHEELPWITLVTCKDYDAKSQTYLSRVVIRAVQIKIDPQ